VVVSGMTFWFWRITRVVGALAQPPREARRVTVAAHASGGKRDERDERDKRES